MKRTYCGRWLKADPIKHGVARLVCTQLTYHAGPWHRSHATGWMWSTRGTDWPGRLHQPDIVREWWCRGWVKELNGLCGRTLIATEDGARVKGWRIQPLDWRSPLSRVRDQLCPQCGKPDPVAAQLARDLARSVRR